MFDREFQEAIAAVEVELVRNIHPVVFDRLFADGEERSDLFAHFILSNKPENSLFHGSELVKGRLLRNEGASLPATSDEMMGERWTDIMISSDDGPHTFKYDIHCRFLQHVTADARIDHAIEDRFVVVHREDDDFHLRVAVAEMLSDFKAGHAREIEIEEKNPGLELLDERFHHASVAGFRNHVKIGIPSYQITECLPVERMVLRDDDRRGLRFLHFRLFPSAALRTTRVRVSSQSLSSLCRGLNPLAEFP